MIKSVLVILNGRMLAFFNKQQPDRHYMNDIQFTEGEKPLSFPKLGGAYDSYSFLIHTKIEGNRTYKQRLDRYIRDLAKELLEVAKHGYSNIKIKRLELEKGLTYLVHSIAHVASIPSKYKYLSLSLNRNDYYGINAQFNMLPYNGIKTAIKLLEICSCSGNEAFVVKIKGHRNPATNAGLRTRIEPTKAFLNILIIQGLIFPGHPHGLKKNNRPKENQALLQLTTYDSSSEEESTRALRRDLNDDEAVLFPLNKKLKELRVDFHIPDYSIYFAHWDFKYSRSKLRHMSGTYLVRKFKHNDGHAGRLYGHWVQQCPSGLRRYLTFNGKATIELDYSSMQLYLLYGLADKLPPSGDLYAFERIDRHWMKAVLTRSVGANTRADATASFRAELAEFSPKVLSKAEIYFDLFWERHSAVYDLLFTGATWAKLQYLDSTIALRVLKRLLDLGIVCIPIHDSFVVQAQYKRELEDAMITAFKSIFPTMDPILK